MIQLTAHNARSQPGTQHTTQDLPERTRDDDVIDAVGIEVSEQRFVERWTRQARFRQHVAVIEVHQRRCVPAKYQQQALKNNDWQKCQFSKTRALHAFHNKTKNVTDKWFMTVPVDRTSCTRRA